MAQSLALELYQLIMQHVNDKTDLRSLALCWSGFRDEAQRCLFRHAEPESLDQQNQLIATINTAPLRLGTFVHTFHIKDGLGFDSNGRPVSGSLSLALRAMQNLKHLTINSGRALSILQGCAFSLHTLVYRHPVEGADLAFLLCTFLPTQNYLKRLKIIHNVQYNISEVPTDLCPKLDSLGIRDARLVRAILGDRKLISHFQWYKILAPPALTSYQLNHLKSLLFCIYDISNMDTSFTLHLTSLIYLELWVNLHDHDFSDSVCLLEQFQTQC